MTLHIGDVFTATVTFRNSAGVPTNTSATVRVRKPDGTITSASPALVATAHTDDGVAVDLAQGHYHHDIPITADGRWEYGFTGTGAVAAAEPGHFYVSRSRVLT